uniref:NADH-ubiquinone oxidoreductase chain 3 n=1 Tax=Dypsocus coleoptratus TaxID=297941 RepID=A0A8K1ZFC4_9NEOP|nr:NADH dehydrogenase subunit 3 [Dypsocus coleoptratus]
MLNMIYSFTFIFFLANLLMTLCIIISKKTLIEREKLSSFECGFDQKSSSRLPFSLPFFLISIIFLIFDVEIALILPSITMMKFCNPMYWLIINTFFIMILIIGVVHEWNQNMLNWSY